MPPTDDPKKLAAALEKLEAKRERRIEEKIESGKAVRVPPLVVGGPESIDAAMAHRLAELREAGETREIIFGEKVREESEPISAIITGVPRAGRDPKPRVTSAPTSVSPTKTPERQPEGVALRVSTALGERDLYMKHHPQPTPPPDTSEPAQRHYVRATIAPRSEADPGAVVEGSFTVDGGMVRVYQGNQLLGSSPYKPGDDVKVIARKLLREHSGGSGFHGPLNYPRSSFH